MKYLRPSSNKGFTLIELLVVVAILGILVAIAIPQYVNFLARARRSEAFIIARGVHSGQTAYFASQDHYLQVCGASITGCNGTTIRADGVSVREIQKVVGLDVDPSIPIGVEPLTRNGYRYVWLFEGGTDDNYEFDMVGNIKDDVATLDTVAVLAGNSFSLSFYQPCGLEAGVPFILVDDVTNYHCP